MFCFRRKAKKKKKSYFSNTRPFLPDFWISQILILLKQLSDSLEAWFWSWCLVKCAHWFHCISCYLNCSNFEFCWKMFQSISEALLFCVSDCGKNIEESWVGELSIWKTASWLDIECPTSPHKHRDFYYIISPPSKVIKHGKSNLCKTVSILLANFYMFSIHFMPIKTQGVTECYVI